jgi:transketolase
MRFKAYGWNVVEVAALPNGDVDRAALEEAMLKIQSEKKAPSLIRLKTVIAWPAPKAQGTAESHGSALGADEVSATKVALGLDPEKSFDVPDSVLNHARKVLERGAAQRKQWESELAAWAKSYPKESELLTRLQTRNLPKDWDQVIPTFESGKDIATRAASGKVINAIAGVLPEFWGGSSDLAGSNNTTINNGGSFLPVSSKMKDANPYGRVVHFGIREHAMGAILNGIGLHGLTRTFGGTFLVFSDYMRGAVRLAALMNIPSIFVWSHDSIGLGEDGPTHQPVEHIASLRLIPNLAIVRPADANETAIAWREIITRDKPVGLALSRQNLPVFERTAANSADGVSKGAYVIIEPEDEPDVILIATGSEVHIAIEAAKILAAEKIAARVVSVPCLEWFEEQSDSYKESVLPKKLRARVSIEAGVGTGWQKYVGDIGEIISLEHFGASASAGVLFKEYGFTPENVAESAKRTIARA